MGKCYRELHLAQYDICRMSYLLQSLLSVVRTPRDRSHQTSVAHLKKSGSCETHSTFYNSFRTIFFVRRRIIPSRLSLLFLLLIAMTVRPMRADYPIVSQRCAADPTGVEFNGRFVHLLLQRRRQSHEQQTSLLRFIWMT